VSIGIEFGDVHVVVTDEGMYTGTGLVHRWLIGVGNRLYQNTVAAAPERSGQLKAGIDLDFTQGPTLRVLEAVVMSTAEHTGYVIHGTGKPGKGRAGWIYRSSDPADMARANARLAGDRGVDTEGLWMRLSDARDGNHLRVHGQEPNNFMLAGFNRTARTHRALHPIFPGFVT
jgi:hypothetical protein